ncbi:MAG: DUF1552 domain-containing protein [Vicinamibacterales bacterium]
MIVTKKALPRRTFLRGMGVTVALPLLDAMVPALTAQVRTAARPVRRVGFIYIPNGTIQPMWVPTTAGADFEWSPILSPLAPLRDRIVVLSGLAHMEADSRGDGNGDHARATAVWLTGVHAYDRDRTGVAGVQLATTVDQIIARELGRDTRLPSLELSLEKPTQIGCDSEDCFFANTISWRSPTTPLSMEAHPRVVFERLFGDGGTAAQRSAQTRRTGTILDSVTDEVTALERALGSSDRTKLDEYLEAVRELEQRVQNMERRAEVELSVPDRPTDIPDTFEEHAKLMFDLQVVAYQADITRVVTMLLARETSTLTYEHIGVPEQHHSCSHHLNNPALIARKAKIDQYHVQLLGYFLKRLRDTADGDGSLLDHSLILYGGGLGNGNIHDHLNLPCVLAGGAAGQLKGGRHLAYPGKTPMTNLLLTMMDKVGIPTPERIGDSTTHLSGV